MATIILADSEAATLDVLASSVRKLRPDWQIHAMNTGQEVLQFLQTNHVDCVITETSLQDMTGLELLSSLKASYPDTVRFTLSADLDHEIVLDSTRANHRFINRAVTCEVLVSAIACSLRLAVILNGETVKRGIGDINSLPALPEIYQQMVSELTSSHSSLMNVARIIETDAGLTATVLKIVNCAFYGLNQRVESVSQGVSLLGVHLIKNITLTAKVFAQFETGGLDLRRLRRLNDDANKTGALCNHFARLARVPRSVVDHAQIAGMLSNTGELIALDRRSSDVPDNRDVETEVLGACLLRHWLLPDAVVEAVALQHESPPRSTTTLTPLLIVHAIRFLAKELTDVSNSAQREACLSYLADMVSEQIAEQWLEAYTDLQQLTAHGDSNQPRAA